MASIFTKGVITASKRLQGMRDDLAGLISVMEAKRDLHSFDSRHPGVLPASVADLKDARDLIYRALERLNFPDKFSDPEN